MYPRNQNIPHQDKTYDTEYPSKKRSLLGYFFSYLKKPQYINKSDDKKLRLKFWDMFRLLSATLIIALILGFIITFALLAVGYDTSGGHELSDPEWQNPFYLFFFGVIFAPFVEEMAFRMGLKFSPFRLSFSLALLSYFLYPTFFNLIGIELTEEISTFMPLLLLLIVGLIFGFILRLINEKKPVEIFYRKYFFIIFYSSAVLFAAVHLTNYSGFNQIWFLAPLLVSPQFIGGLTMGFVRVNFGLQWSIFQHMLWNGFLFSPTVFLGYLDSVDFKNISDFDLALVSISSVTLIGIVLACLVSAVLLLVEFAKKDM